MGTLWDDIIIYEYYYKKILLQNEWREYCKMGKFLHKMNHVNVQNVCLGAEKAKLYRENTQLKHYIKRYLTELALKSEKARPLSVRLQSDMKKEVLKMYVKVLYLLFVKCIV